MWRTDCRPDRSRPSIGRWPTRAIWAASIACRAGGRPGARSPHRPAATQRQQPRAAPAAQVALAVARELAPLAESQPVTDADGHAARLSVAPSSRAGRRRGHRAPVTRAPGGVRRAGRAGPRVCRARSRRAGGWAGAVVGDPPLARRADLCRAHRREGVRLLDAQAARFADVDDVQLVGLVEGEWPERTRRSIFYPPSLLGLLDPTPAAEDPNQRESDAMAAARAMFLDLLGLARERVRVSTFSLESDAVVEPSTFVDDLATAGLRPPGRARGSRAGGVRGRGAARRAAGDRGADALGSTVGGLAPGPAAGNDPRFTGEAGPWVLPRVSVSRIDRYLKCPFQFFASEVLQLEEEPEDEDAPPPLERGRFLHALFETFFREWQRRGRGGITAERRARGARAVAGAVRGGACRRCRRPRPASNARASSDRPPAPASSIACSRWRPNGRASIDRRLIEYELDDAFVFRRANGETPDGRRCAPRSIAWTCWPAAGSASSTTRRRTCRTRSARCSCRSTPPRVRSSCTRPATRSRRPTEAFYLSIEGPRRSRR